MKIALLNFSLNKFCPYGSILLIMFFTVGTSEPFSYLIIPFIMFIDKFSFKTGYSVAYCECHNIDLKSSID